MVRKASCTFVRNRNGNLNVPYLIENGDQVKLNWNWLDNNWNDNNPALRFATLFVSKPRVFSVGLGFVSLFVHTSRPAFSQLSPLSPKVHRTSLCRVLSTPTQPLEEYEACRVSVLPYGDRVLCLRAAGNSLPPSPRLSRLRGHQSVPRESIASCSVCLDDTRTIRYKPLSRILGLAESSGGGVRFA